MGKSVDMLDVYTHGGPEAVRTLIDQARPLTPAPPADEGEQGGGVGPDTAGGDDRRRIIPNSPTGQGEAILIEMFSPERLDADGSDGGGWPYRLRYFAGGWFIRVTGRMQWREVKEPELVQMIRRHFRNHWLPAVGKRESRPWAPKTDAVRDALLSVMPLVHVPGDQMPCWLPSQEASMDSWVLNEQAQGPIRRDAVVAFNNGLLDTDAWSRGEVRLLPMAEVGGRWFSSTVLDSDLPDLPPPPEDPEGEGEADLCWQPDELFERHCPSWVKFLGDLSNGDREWVEPLQRFMGLLLIPDTSLQRILWIQGVPASGKGTIERVIINMLGKASAAMTEWNTLGERFELAGFVGKLALIMPELHVGRDRSNTASLSRFKSISGGDPVSVEAKHGAKQTMVHLAARFIVTPNQEPSLGDASGALMRRLVILRLVNSFVGREDFGLGPRLETEIPWIRVWALYGLRRLRLAVRCGDDPFPEPGSSAALRGDITKGMSPVLAWTRERCVIGPEHSCTREAAFSWWQRWADEEGHGYGGNSWLGRQLRACLPGLGESQPSIGGERKRVYVGFRPLREHEDAATAEVIDGAMVEVPPKVDEARRPVEDKGFNSAWDDRD